MTELWEAVKAWPVIVQGALGSALFAAVVFIGQKLSAMTSPRIVQLSSARKRSLLVNQITRIRAVTAQNKAARGYFASILLLRSSRSLIKALIWLALGLCFGSFVSALGVVGYLGCIFYLFGALDIVKGIKRDGNEEQRLAELVNQLKVLDGDGDV